MTSRGADRDGGLITACVFGLVVMATWTLVIKFLAPALFGAAESAAGRAVDRVPVMWDFWWVLHLGLAWLLWRRHRFARPAALAIAAAEVTIVGVKLFLYARHPDRSFWGLLWLTNKAYVLVFFLLLLALLFTPRFRAALEVRHE